MNENVLKEEISMLENQIRILQQQNQELKIQVSAREEVYNKYKEVIDRAIKHLDLFIWEEQLSKYDTLKILTHTKEILKGDNNE